MSMSDERRKQLVAEGAKAFADGKTLLDNPYAGTVGLYPWAMGWGDARDKVQRGIRQQEACRVAAKLQKRRDEHDLTYCSVSSKLAELGIDPYQLRDYLADLP